MIYSKQTSGFLVDVRDEHSRRRRRKKPRKRLLVMCVCLIVFAIVLPLSGYIVLHERYQHDIAQARVGASKLEAGIALLRTLPRSSFSIGLVGGAEQDFNDALATFSPLNGDVNLIPDVLGVAFGSRVHAAKHLVPLAIDAAQAGLAACTFISTLLTQFHNPLHKATGLTASTVSVLDRNVQQIVQELAQVIEQANQLQPGDLQFDPALGKTFGEFRAYLPLMQQVVDQAPGLISALPRILGVGQPAYYLVEILDSSELRPGGGFIGNYGIVTLNGGLVTSAQVTDTYLLDRASAVKRHIAFPAGYAWFPFKVALGGWGLRDSNLDADFPTSARNGEMLYSREGGTLPLAGVIAITPQFMEQILNLTGPLAIPEYHEVVTAQNFVDLIHYHQLNEAETNSLKPVPSSDGLSSTRKHFTALLGQYVFARLHALPASMLSGLFQALADSLHTGDLQMYFNDGAAQKLLHIFHADNSIQSPAGDGIFVVDANITPSKANAYLVTTINDRVTIDVAGSAEHTTAIRFTWTKPGLTARDLYGSPDYSSFIQVYVPTGSVLQKSAGWSLYSSGIAFARTYWEGYFQLDYPLTGAITLVWSVAGSAQQNGHTWHYLYSLQRQAGALEDVNLQETLPSCAAIVHTSLGIVADSKRQAHLAQVLSQDTAASIDYTC